MLEMILKDYNSCSVTIGVFSNQVKEGMPEQFYKKCRRIPEGDLGQTIPTNFSVCSFFE